MKGKRVDFRLDYQDNYKLDYCVQKLGIHKSELLRALICCLFHDLNPPFRDYSS